MYRILSNDDSKTLRFVIPYLKGYYLVNTSGNIQKSKSAAKDGDEWYFYVDDYAIKLYANSKELTPDKGVTDSYNLDNWKKWFIDKNGAVVYK